MDRGAFREGFQIPRAEAVEHTGDGAPSLRAAPAADIGVLRGTRVKTLRGEVAVEALRAGDRVLTRDNGYRPVDWSGRAAPPLSGSDRAVRLRKGALGRGIPERCLWVAPGQRLLIGGERLRATFGQPEVLVDARHLTCLSGVALCTAPPLPLVQIRLDRHELILCEGTWCDSLPGGPEEQENPARPVLQGDDLREVLRLLMRS